MHCGNCKKMIDHELDSSLESLEGVVERVTFVNGFFSINIVQIAKSSFDYDQGEITVVGHFGRLQVGKAYRFMGRLQRNYRHGTQFVVKSYQHLD